MQLEWLLATSPAGVSWILARVTKYALEREFRDYNKVSCDVECWLLCEATASSGFALQNTIARDIGTLTIDDEMGRRRRPEVKFSRANLLGMR